MTASNLPAHERARHSPARAHDRLLLALSALTFKAFLPPGYMLSPANGHGIVVALRGGGEAILDLGGAGRSDRPVERAPHDNADGSIEWPNSSAVGMAK